MGVFEGCITQSIAERIKLSQHPGIARPVRPISRLPAMGTGFEGEIQFYLSHRFGERNRQFASGIIIPEQSAGNHSAPLASRESGFKNGRHIPVCPIDSKGLTID